MRALILPSVILSLLVSVGCGQQPGPARRKKPVAAVDDTDPNVAAEAFRAESDAARGKK